MSDEVMLSGRVPEELKRLVDADERNNQEVMRSALWDEFGGERETVIDQRIQNKKKQLSAAEETLNDERENVSELREELEELREMKETVEEKNEREEAELQKVIDRLRDGPRDPENPAIKTNAERLGMTPEELLDELPEKNDGGLSSL